VFDRKGLTKSGSPILVIAVVRELRVGVNDTHSSKLSNANDEPKEAPTPQAATK
jgi:hypothetical protein